MDYLVLNRELENYIKDLKSTSEYKELKEVYAVILEKYSDLVNEFTKAKESLEKAMEYGDYYPGLKDLKLKYQDAKTNLYSKPELKRYFELTKDIEEMANSTLAEIKNEII